MFMSEEAWNERHHPEPLATMSEASREYALNVGRDLAETGDTKRAWILGPYDTWEPNPFYVGPPVGHPEDYCPEEEDETLARSMPDEENYYAPALTRTDTAAPWPLTSAAKLRAGRAYDRMNNIEAGTEIEDPTGKFGWDMMTIVCDRRAMAGERTYSELLAQLAADVLSWEEA